jgi:D-apiose dehydrogenase
LKGLQLVQLKDNSSIKPLHGALIGAGAISKYHLSAWEKIHQADIIAICDPNIQNVERRAIEFCIPQKMVFSNPAEMFRSIPLDFVDIAAPPEAHLELTELAAIHKVHVNCQKPFALNLPDARQMAEVCQQAGVILNINENWRWRAWYRTIRQIIMDGKIGKPVYARVFSHSSRYLKGSPDLNRSFDWRHVILLEIGVHHVDVLRFLFGEPISVTARTNDVSHAVSGEDRTIVLLDFPDNLHAILDLSWSSFSPAGYADRDTHPIEDCRIEGDRGTIELVRDNRKGNLIRLTNTEGILEKPAHPNRTPAESYLDSYIAAQGHFIQCLMSGRIPETAAADNFETLAIVLAAYRSAELRQTVSITQFKAGA